MRFLRIKAVMDKVGLKQDSIYRLAREGKFPRQIKISQWASAWLESDVEEWMTKRIAEQRENEGR